MWNDEDYGTPLGECRVTDETESAVHIVRKHDGFSDWFPKSQIHADSECWKDGDSGVFVISDWLAGERGL
jgi:hypothetical protein